jgi:WD40 repeat protein
VTLAPDGEALVGRGAPAAGPRVHARVTLALDDGPLAADFELPVAPDAIGAAGVAQTACTPATARDGPRCTLAFSQPVTALALAPDGARLAIAAVGSGVTLWRLPDATLDGALAPAPPVAMPPGEQPHAEIVSALLWRPDGAELAAVHEGRLLLYAVPVGHLDRVVSGPGDVVRDASWWPDGSRLVVTAFHDPAAHVVDAASGAALARYDVGSEAAAVLVEPGAASMLVGSEAGTVARFRTGDAQPVATFAPSSRAVVSLARAGSAVLVLTMDGAVQALDADDGRPRTTVLVGFTPTRFAVGPQDFVAVGLPSGRVAVVDTVRGTVVRTLDGPAAQILAVAWSGRTLVTGDATGRVALWDVGP